MSVGQMKEVLTLLAAELSKAFEPFGTRCLRAVPRIDGSMYFDLEKPPVTLRMDWHLPLEEKNCLQLTGIKDGKTSKNLISAAKSTLSRLCESDAFEILRWYNREIRRLTFDDAVVDVLFAGRLQPAKSAWFDYFFKTVFQEASDRIRITFLGPSGPVSFEIRPALPRYDGPQVILKNNVFYLVLVEDNRPAENRKFLPHQVERFLGFLLSRAVHNGMRLEVVSQGSGDEEPISSSRWGNSRQWYQFFSDFEIERSNLCSLRFSDPVVWITHGEPECRFVEPETLTETVYWTCLPWKLLPWKSPPGESIQTNLTEKDCVLGGMNKLQKALSQALRCPGAQFVCVNNTCLPKIIGDDVPSLIRQHAKNASIPIFDLNTSLETPDSAFEDLVRQAAEAATKNPGEYRGLNLVGFPPTKGFEELKEACSAIGLEIASTILPELGVKALERYCWGKVAFVYPHRTWLRICKSVLGKLGVEVRTSLSPYGLEESKKWLLELAQAEGKEEIARAWLEKNLPPLEEKWLRLREQARRFRIALVADVEEADRFFEPEKLHGFRLAPLLEEMGFGLDFLLRGKETDGRKILEKLQGQEHQLHFFSEPQEFEGLLRQGKFSLIFTEIFYDRRILRAGKMPLHLAWIEMGLHGAIRSLEKILHSASWNFYSKYRNYLP